MDSLIKQRAFWVVVALLAVMLLPIIASCVVLPFRALVGDQLPGSALLALIENPDSPPSIAQKLVIPILGLVSLPVLWGEKGGYALILILVCLCGIALTSWLWFHLSDPDNAADLWQEASGALNGTTFPAAMRAYMKAVTAVLGANLLLVFGLKGVEWLKSIMGGQSGG